MNPTYEWYSQLIKPSWAPPAFLFGPVWSILYVLIALTFGYVLKLWWSRKIDTKVIIPFGLNIIFNLIFTPIQFGLRNNYLALADIVLVLATLVWAMKKIYRIQPKIAWAQIPYLTWVTFATFLQLNISLLNR